MKVVFLSEQDFAGSGIFAVQGINRWTDIQARQVNFMRHPFGYPNDLSLSDDKEETLRVVKEADIVNICNMSPLDPNLKKYGIDSVADDKYTFTYTGSLYRENRQNINSILKKLNKKPSIQNPTYINWSEIESVFVPHTIPEKLFNIYPLGQKIERGKEIVSYRRKNKTTTTLSDLQLLESICKANGYPYDIRENIIDWDLWIKFVSIHNVYFQYLDEEMGYWGRSTLEACALGLVPIVYYNATILYENTKIYQPPFPPTVKEDLEDNLRALFYDLDIGTFYEKCQKCRKWAHDNFSESRVSGLWIEYFESL